MAIYTKTGDKGTTKVFDKKNGELTSIRKDSCHIKTIGAIDELNSFLGVIKSQSDKEKSLNKKIQEVQENLFIINSVLAGGKITFSKTKTKKLEKTIDELEGSLPVQKNFIFYGGSQTSAFLFYARALARRAERSLTAFAKKEKVPEAVSTYFNRLSDYLFILARNINFENKVKEDYWITKTSR